MTCRHRRGTTSFPPPATRRPQRRHPPSTPRARSPPRTAADPLAGPPAGGPATAGPAYQSPALPSLSDVPSQHLAFEVLRRLVESAGNGVLIAAALVQRGGELGPDHTGETPRHDHRTVDRTRVLRAEV